MNEDPLDVLDIVRNFKNHESMGAASQNFASTYLCPRCVFFHFFLLFFILINVPPHIRARMLYFQKTLEIYARLFKNMTKIVDEYNVN